MLLPNQHAYFRTYSPSKSEVNKVLDFAVRVSGPAPHFSISLKLLLSGWVCLCVCFCGNFLLKTSSLSSEGNTFRYKVSC